MDNLWLDIRNSAGHLLFRYNPSTNEIEFRKGGWVYELIRLDDIRAKYGIVDGSPEKSFEVIIVEAKKNGKGS